MPRSTTALLVGLLVVVAAVGSAGVALALTGDDAPATPAVDRPTSDRTITVAASGQAQAQPDTAILRVAVEAADPEASVARNRVAQNVSSVKAALTDLGIDAAQITTTDYRISHDERRSPEPTKPDQPAVYRVQHVLSVQVEDTDQVGAVIDAVVDAGATNIYDVQFTLSQETRDQLRNEALTAAMVNARRQAGTLADSANLTVVSTRTVRTGGSFDGPVRYETTALAGGAAAATDVNAGPVTVRATVTVTYNASD